MAEEKDVKPNIASLMASSSAMNKRDLLGIGHRSLIQPGAMSSRLPSFKAPRDLTLSSSIPGLSGIKPQLIGGGGARQKKKVMPNIPTKREKSVKLTPSLSEKLAKKPQIKNKPQGKGKSKRDKEFVQMKGSLFGDGIAFEPTLKHSSKGHSSSQGGGRSTIDHFVKPVLDVNAAYNYDKDLEDRKLKELMRDDFIDDPDDFSITENFPVRLPLIESIGNNQDSDISSKNSIKEEHLEDDMEITEQMLSKVKIRNNMDNPMRRTLEDSVTTILSENNNDFIFMQLPNSLPCHSPQVTTTAKPSNESNPTIPDLCNIANLPEGRLGSLKIYKSGKVELWLGEHKLLINKGTSTGFLQDAVSITTDSESRTGALSVLGRVKHRLVCSPDFQHLSKPISGTT